MNWQASSQSVPETHNITIRKVRLENDLILKTATASDTRLEFCVPYRSQRCTNKVSQRIMTILL